jgi:hypothetical protein
MSNEVHVNVAAPNIPGIITHATKKTLIASPVLPEINPHAISISPTK